MPNIENKHTFSLLIADDDSNLRAALKRVLRRLDCDIIEASSGEDAQRKMTSDIAVAVLDVEMPGGSGLEALTHIKSNFPDTPVIILSGKGTTREIVNAMDQGAFWYLAKPFDSEELIALITRAWSHHELARSHSTLRAGLGQFGTLSFARNSSVMSDLISKIEKLSELDSTVLLTGETGTGKTSLARLIHQKSPRCQQSFVTINCAAVPRDLLESELFGHERGAFTGALSARAGCVEIADKGTLFLDEIGDLPLDLQPKLLSFLQDGRFRRVGGRQEKIADTRIIAATNRNLEEMCREKLFREDLYFRINVLALTVPPLRSRPEDILPLATQVLERISSKRGVSLFQFSESAKTALLQYSWPGNIRELENILERATAFASGKFLETKDLGLHQKLSSEKESNPTEIISFEELTLEQIEKLALLQALKRYHGNKSQVARALGISPKSVYNKLQKFQIE